MRPSIKEWLGEDRPKQYCTFVGSRSMLRHTWDRALALSTPERLVTVVAREHRSFLEAEAENGGIPGNLLEQPRDRGTAVGVLFPLAFVLARDPRALVLIVPADHFIRPESGFLRVAASACLLAQKLQRLVLLAATPDRPETDYGWLLPHRLPGATAGSAPLPLQELHEKPDPERARELQAAGALWNTMITASPASTLWRLGQQRLPEAAAGLRVLSPLLERAEGCFPDTASELVALDSTYRTLPRGDFSRDVLATASTRPLVLPLGDVEWNDWGRPERIAQTLAPLGKQSSFAARGVTAFEAAADGSA